ncbi:hypothetical protein GGI20_002736 [Coemansia sp. BCRC 34301]|nr:hypothetical protein GGI20_002736 [Coemansia sp. BCRC 34301]
MSIINADGRQAFISLLVDWSLCSVDCLGFGPSIRYALGSSADRLHFEIDVHEKSASTGEVASHTYYSNRCFGVAPASFTGRLTRYFAASANAETMGDPTVLIKDTWVPLGSDTLGKDAVLDVLHAAFNKDSELRNSFPQFVSAGPVYVCKGDSLVKDTTATAFAGLPTTSMGETATSSGDSA